MNIKDLTEKYKDYIVNLRREFHENPEPSLGVPFSAPVAPFDGKDLKEYMLSDISIAKDRPDYLNPKDKTRQIEK